MIWKRKIKLFGLQRIFPTRPHIQNRIQSASNKYFKWMYRVLFAMMIQNWPHHENSNIHCTLPLLVGHFLKFEDSSYWQFPQPQIVLCIRQTSHNKKKHSYHLKLCTIVCALIDLTAVTIWLNEQKHSDHLNGWYFITLFLH